jgi:hypothetical protein
MQFKKSEISQVLQLSRTESPYWTKSDPPRQCPAGPDNVWPGADPGVFKPMNRCRLLKLSFSPRASVASGFLPPIFLSDDQQPLGRQGGFLGSSSSVGTPYLIFSASSSSSTASR